MRCPAKVNGIMNGKDAYNHKHPPTSRNAPTGAGQSHEVLSPRFSLEENQIPAAANSRVPRSNSAAASI
jgi:hypothetical protein